MGNLNIPDCVELGGNDVRGKGEKVALVQTYPPVIGLKDESFPTLVFAIILTHCEKGSVNPFDGTPRVFNVVFTEKLCARLQQTNVIKIFRPGTRRERGHDHTCSTPSHPTTVWPREWRWTRSLLFPQSGTRMFFAAGSVVPFVTTPTNSFM